LTRSWSETPKSAIGLSASFERTVIGPLFVRASLGAWASLPGGDPVSVCAPLPNGGCARAPVVPSRLRMAELHAAVPLLPVIPFFGIAGAGVVFPHGDRVDTLPATRGILRTGFELGDGRRWRGIRLQWTRLVFRGPVRDLRSARGGALLLRW
jgi:hypothetical protein